MSRRDEVEAKIAVLTPKEWCDASVSIARTLADEVDELRAEISDYKDLIYHNSAAQDLSLALAIDKEERLWRCIKTAISLKNKYRRDRAERDQVITALLELVKPIQCTKSGKWVISTFYTWRCLDSLYRCALEIAGRPE